MMNIGRTISLTKPGSFDIKILKDTNIAPCKNLKFRFEEPPQSLTSTIKEVKDHAQYAKVCHTLLVEASYRTIAYATFFYPPL